MCSSARARGGIVASRAAETATRPSAVPIPQCLVVRTGGLPAADRQLQPARSLRSRLVTSAAVSGGGPQGHHAADLDIARSAVHPRGVVVSGERRGPTWLPFERISRRSNAPKLASGSLSPRRLGQPLIQLLPNLCLRICERTGLPRSTEPSPTFAQDSGYGPRSAHPAAKVQVC